MGDTSREGEAAGEDGAGFIGLAIGGRGGAGGGGIDFFTSQGPKNGWLRPEVAFVGGEQTGEISLGGERESRLSIPESLARS